MISSTGNNFLPRVGGQKGHTFLELMVAVSILSVGIVAIYQGLLKSLEYQSQLSSRLYAMNLLDHEAALIEKKFQTEGQFPIAENGKIVETSLDYHDIAFQFEIRAGTFANLEGLQQAEITLTWLDQGRTLSLKRSIYLVNLHLKPVENAEQ